MSEQTCRGCGEPAPADDADALTRWAVVDQARNELYCPNCLTPGESDCLSAVAVQTFEDQSLLDRLPDARRGVRVPEQRAHGTQPASADQPVVS